MNISKVIFSLKLLNQEIEIFSIFAWLLFYPVKTSFFYYLIFAILANFFLIKNIVISRNIGLNWFSYSLIIINVLLLFSICFANFKQRAILFYFDILLISFYYIFFYYDEKRRDKFMRLFSYSISLFSLLVVINRLTLFSGKEKLFFENSILQGVMSGIGVLLVFYLLLKRFDWLRFVFLCANIAAVYISESKAAFLGVVFFSLLFIFKKNKKLVLFVILLITLTFIIPNPIKKAFEFSIKRDPYVADRIHIWRMTLKIFADHVLFGVGMDNFAEVSTRYNFKQKMGPANYFKIPQQPHNDYLKLLSETGLIGLLILLFSLFFIFKKTFGSHLNIINIVALYLLLQAFLFNILLRPVFFFILLFLLKDMFSNHMKFSSLSTYLKSIHIFFLVVILIVGYTLPYLSKKLNDKARSSPDPVRKINILQTSQWLNPLELETVFLKSTLFYDLFKSSLNLFYFTEALKNIKRGQELNKYSLDFYELEAELYVEVIKAKLMYVSLDEEILRPLERAEHFHPFNPFVKLRKGQILFDFGKLGRAKQEALKAISVEPDFVAALYFLQQNFHYFKDQEAFQEKIHNIREKAKHLKPSPGSYLYHLYAVPKRVIVD